MDHGPGHWMGEKANVEALGCRALARCPLDRPSRKDAPICKPNCKPTTRHRTVSKITSRHRHGKIGELERTLSYRAIRGVTRIIELENRCTCKRTVGSNPTLSAIVD